MLPDIDKVKGVHPGAILDRELITRGIKKSAFAIKIGEYPGIITDITRLRRGMNARLSLRIERELGAEEGYFMVLQSYHEIKMARKKEAGSSTRPDMSIIRPILFWDVDPDSMDFSTRKSFIIKRIFERGNEAEIKEIIRFYGEPECAHILKSARTLLFTAVENGIRFLDLKKENFLCLKNSMKEPLRKPYYRSSGK